MCSIFHCRETIKSGAASGSYDSEHTACAAAIGILREPHISAFIFLRQVIRHYLRLIIATFRLGVRFFIYPNSSFTKFLKNYSASNFFSVHSIRNAVYIFRNAVS